MAETAICCPFLSAKLEERDARITRTGGTRYAVEPNVKDGKGDCATCTRCSGWPNMPTALTALPNFWKLAYCASPKPEALRRRVFMDSSLFFTLHHGREDDRLSFDAQMEIALKCVFRQGRLARGRAVYETLLSGCPPCWQSYPYFCAALETDFDRRPACR